MNNDSCEVGILIRTHRGWGCAYSRNLHFGAGRRRATAAGDFAFEANAKKCVASRAGIDDLNRRPTGSDVETIKNTISKTTGPKRCTIGIEI